jgi:hypothetical protein
MTRDPGARHGPLPRTGLGVVALTVVLGVLFAGIAAPAIAVSPAWDPDPISWTNGVVLCQFAAAAPTVSVSDDSQNGTGLTVGMSGMAEVAPNGSLIAVANLSAAHWSISNVSTDDAFDLAFVATVPFAQPSAGSASVRVDYVLPAYDGSSNGATNTVAVNVSVANWTWEASGDHLAMSFFATPSFPESESLTHPSNSSWMFSNSRNSSGTELEWMQADTVGTARPSSGGNVSISAAPTMSVWTAEWAILSVAFGSGAGDFRSLNYTAVVGVVLPSTIAGIPLVDFAAVGAAAVLVSVGIAAVTRSLRRRPSDLTYVDEEGP